MANKPIIRRGPWISSGSYIGVPVWPPADTQWINARPINCQHGSSVRWPWTVKSRVRTLQFGNLDSNTSIAGVLSGEISRAAQADSEDNSWASLDFQFAYQAANPFELTLEYDVFAYADCTELELLNAEWRFQLTLPIGATSDLSNSSDSDDQIGTITLTANDSGKLYLPSTVSPLTVSIQIEATARYDDSGVGTTQSQSIVGLKLSGITESL